MMHRLVDHLDQGPVWKLHGFFRGLALTDQDHILKLLGVDPSLYRDSLTASQPPPTATPQGIVSVFPTPHTNLYGNCLFEECL